jgi:YceI-like domain
VKAASASYELGPDDGTVAVRTRCSGAAAKAGHDLLLHVTVWRAAVEVDAAESPLAISFEADATSFRVIEGTGGIQALDDDDRASIVQTIDDEILQRAAIGFRSTGVEETGPGSFRVRGDLTLAGATHPVEVEVKAADGRLHAAAAIVQSSWGVKPYSALFGALKVADEVSVEIDATLPAR